MDLTFLFQYPNGYIFITIFFLLAYFTLIPFGLSFTKYLINKNYFNINLTSFLCFVTISLMGYISVWLFLLNKIVGYIYLLVIFLFFLKEVHNIQKRKSILLFVKDPDVYIPLLLTLSIGLYFITLTYGLVYSSLTELGIDYKGILLKLVTIDGNSPDYLLQKSWHDKLINGKNVWNVVLDPLIAESTLADRPPLLGGISTLTLIYALPLRLLNLGLVNKDFFDPLYFHFMGVTTLVSLIWITVVWALFRTLHFSKKFSTLAIVCLSHIYFLYFSSVFTWPKSLAGSLLIGVFIMFICVPITEHKKLTTNQIIIGSLTASLAAFAHFSVIISLLFIGLILLTPKIYPGIKNIFIGSCVFLILTTPYLLLKSYYEGENKLAKYTMTTPDFKPMKDEHRSMTTKEAVKDAYSTLTTKEVIDNKLFNLKTIFASAFNGFGIMQMQKSDIANNLVLKIFGSLNLLNLFWIFFIPYIWTGIFKLNKNNLTQNKITPNTIKTISNYCILIAFSSFIILALINFRQEVLNINNTGPTLLLMLALLLRVFSLSESLAKMITGLHILFFYLIIISISNLDGLIINYAMLPSLFITIITLICLYRNYNTQNTQFI